jgi:RNA polymerase sigma-70 factor, ECF subfamily
LIDGARVNSQGEVGLAQVFDPLSVFQERLGFVPNVVRAHCAVPRLTAAHAKLEEAVTFRDGAISRIRKEQILLSIAADRRDCYCAALDSGVLRSLGAPQTQIDDLLLDYRRAYLSGADRTLLEFCLRLSRNATSIRYEHIEALRTQGFSDEAILEAVVVTAVAIYRCTLSLASGPEPDFAPPNFPDGKGSGASEASHGAATADGPAKAGKKGPYLPAPYLSPNSFAPFALVQKSHGFIPNFFRAQTLRPDLLQAELEAVGAILLPEDLLTRVQKESILLTVSAANLNSYCVAVHCNMLRGLGLSAEEADQVAVDYRLSGLPQADVALMDFAVKLGARFSEFSREDAGKLEAFGFTPEQMLEAAVVTALNNFSNALQMGLGIEPDFAVPPVFEQNKVNPSGAAPAPMAGEGRVHLVETSQDADWEVVAQAQGGNLEAFEELARRHTQLIYRTLIAILGDAADAQDAMQDTLLSAFKGIGGFQGRSKFSTWLVSIARNAALQRLRSRKNIESLDQPYTDDEGDFRPRQVRAWQADPEQWHSKTEIRDLVEKGLLQIPPKYRIVVVLRDIEQLSSEEVARQLGLSIPAVKTRLLRGRLMLREWLSPHLAESSKGAAR